MTEGTTMSGFPVYASPDFPAYGTAEARIEVTRWGTIYPPGGQGAVFKGQRIYAYGRQGQELYRETLDGHRRWDAGVRNQMGTLGAVCFDPPTAAEVDAAIERARRALIAEANLLAQAPPVRPGWSAWEYQPFRPPYPNEPEGKRGLLNSVWRPGGDEYWVTGRGNYWTVATDAVSGPGQCIFWDDTIYPSADAAMRACEAAVRDG